MDPVGNVQEKARAWAEYDEAKTTLRVVLEMARNDKSLVEQHFRFIIDPIDAAHLPDSGEVVVVGSDADGFGEADGGVISAGDLSSGHMFLGFGEQYVKHLSQHGDSRAEFIFVLELLVMVALACERAPHWRGRIVFFIVDNDKSKGAVNRHTSS